jgi:general secretion pathway protein L
MTQFLVLRLSDPPSWVVVDATGARLGPVGTGDLADAVPLATERRIIAIAPSSDVTLAEPELPVKSSGRLAQIVPYALEETLAGDIEDFHFAIGKRGDRAGTPVAAVARERMDSWRTQLAAAGLKVEALLPEPLCLPDNPGKIVVVLENSRLTVRAPAQVPYSLDAEPLTEAFALCGFEGEDRHVQLFVAQQDWEASREVIDVLREVTGSLDMQLLPDGALPLLAAQAVASQPLSLLQGAYAPTTGLLGDIKRWRVPAALAAGLLLLHVGVQAWQLLSLRAEERRVDASIEQTFHALMPDVNRIVDVRAQVSQRLAAAGTTGSDTMLHRLAILGSAMSSQGGLIVKRLAWAGGDMDLTVIAPNAEAIAGLSQVLGQRGLSAQVQSTAAADANVEGRVLVRAMGPT